MDTSPNFSSYDYPWQATLAKISLRLKYEFHALSNVSVVSQQHVPKKLTAEAKYMMHLCAGQRDSGLYTSKCEEG
ncbi:hypothetical protein TNCV_4172771 [Trichonephila clavipes]|nr:hypothetical protein TNCV_4172771 [Trichonephila clavipes]